MYYPPLDSFDTLMDYCLDQDRIVPLDWNKFYNILLSKKPANGKEPPPPILLAVWHEDLQSELQERFAAQILWAEEYEVFDEIAAYIRSLPKTEWCYRVRIMKK